MSDVVRSGGGALCGAEVAPFRSAAASIGGRKYVRRNAGHTRQNSTEIDPAAPTGCSREDERWSKQPRPRYAVRYHMLLDWRAANGQGYVEWRALDAARPATRAAWAAAWGTLGGPTDGTGLMYKAEAAG